MAFPGYRDCGHNNTMTSNAVLIAVCLFGLAAAVSSLVWARRRGERWVAIACIAAAVLAAGLLALACAAYDKVYAGVTVALAASASLIVGALVWEREVRGKIDAARWLRVLVPIVAAAVAVTAALSEWHPPPNQEINVPPLVR